MILTYSIGVCEVRTNFPMVESLVDISNMDDVDVTVFTTDYVYKQFNRNYSNGVNFVVKNDNVSLKSFLKLVSSHSKNLDVLFVDTVGGHSLDYLSWFRYFKPSCFSILTIHNINRWFNPNLRWLPNGYSVSHLLDAHIKYYLRGGILSRFDAFNTIFGNLHSYLEKFTGKPLFSFPFMCYKDSVVEPMLSDRVRVVVPGYVENVRRDYDSVLDAIEGCFDWRDGIEFFLLGKPKGVDGVSIIDRVRGLIERGFLIHYFDEFISFDDWERYMVSADVLFLPIRELFVSVESNEVYGFSKGTGTVSNAIRYGKPFLIPESQEIDGELSGMSHPYGSVDDVIAFLCGLVDDPVLLKCVKSDALSSAKQFDVGFFQDMLRDNILDKVGEKN